MTPIEFPQVNVRLAEDQPEYETLPVFVDMRHHQGHPYAHSMTCCYELSDVEVAEIIANKKIFYRQMTFGKPFQPIFLSTKDPFVEANKEYWPAE